ncbi:MAG TPA: transcription termination/antitermination NusG family protein [Pseudorhizobium sp.]|nr:transcription termination/antitermination NusG family protein [Pseudorhizobium sp.]
MRRIAAHNLREAARSIVERSPESARWFCLHVQKGKEFAVENELIAADVDAFLPREKWMSIRHGRKVAGERAYLPGYLLVRCAPSPAAFQGLRRQRFVIDIVGGRDGHFHVVRDEDVSQFKSLIETPVPRRSTDKSFQDGDSAVIEIGPFSGFLCVVLAVKWCRQPRARVMIDANGRQFEIDSMPLAFLKKL